jgi:hypothetical protein
MSEYKRKFTGNCIPVASPLGRVLINSKESRQISNAIRKLIRTGKPTQVKLSSKTQDMIRKLKGSLQK